MLRPRSQRQRNWRNNSNHRNTGVGTEKIAKENLKRNAKDFGYPPAGFVTPVEYSLLYAMLSEPKVYPESVILKEIADTDLEEYMLVNNTNESRTSADAGQHSHSYAQWSALLAIAMQKWPAQPKSTTNSNSNMDSDSDTTSTTSTNVPQVLCQTLLKAVIRYAEEHDLDRQEEIQEFLQPAVTCSRQRMEKETNLKVVLPMYVGASLTILTGNPIPLWIGYGAGFKNAAETDAAFSNEQANLQSITQKSNRMADVEKTSLLDENEYDDGE